MTARRGGEASVIAALAAGSTVADAGRAGGLSERTVYRRLEDPAFRRQIDNARAEIVAQAVAKLSAASAEAAETLRALLSSDMDFARLAAARSILELGAKLREHEDLSERVRALEERITKGDPTWKPRAI
jgi:hypothetical protein